ncbi:ATV_collapsed_G0024850.mRNA.1.CDS.1 [Saccharomyces cerevisiae]|nr:ATV_collapsed_G0024850.mRNA.1.CDS.1 [Saccharomyces cerevisiae]
MAETIQDAVKSNKQEHGRHGPNLRNDPAYLVTRKKENYGTRANNTKIKKTINTYRNQNDEHNGE